MVRERDPGRQVAAAAPPVNLTAGRVSEGQQMSSFWKWGQEKLRAQGKDCASEPAVLFDSVGTIGRLSLFLAAWRGALDSNGICAR